MSHLFCCYGTNCHIICARRSVTPICRIVPVVLAHRDVGLWWSSAAVQDMKCLPLVGVVCIMIRPSQQSCYATVSTRRVGRCTSAPQNSGSQNGSPKMNHIVGKQPATPTVGVVRLGGKFWTSIWAHRGAHFPGVGKGANAKIPHVGTAIAFILICWLDFHAQVVTLATALRLLSLALCVLGVHEMSQWHTSHSGVTTSIKPSLNWAPNKNSSGPGASARR